MRLHYALNWRGPIYPNALWTFGIADETMGVYVFVEGERPTKNRRHWRYGDILYIGKVYYQDLNRRVRQHLSGPVGKWIDKNAEMPVVLKFAAIECMTTSRISETQVGEIENILISLEQPPANIMHTKTYTGRDIVIENAGHCEPLFKHYETQGDRIVRRN